MSTEALSLTPFAPSNDQFGPGPFNAQSDVLTIYGVALDTSKSIARQVKHYVNKTYPTLTKKEASAKYYEVIRENMPKVDAYEGHAMRSGYTKMVTRVAKDGGFSVKYNPPKVVKASELAKTQTELAKVKAELAELKAKQS